MSTHAEAAGWQPVKLSAKLFGHISQGLYRSSAGAIKELISNSFDADAAYVKIHTALPRFDSFSCEDNGTGMSRKDFDGLMQRGFGNTLKRTKGRDVTEKYHRPIIGRLGIGLLAMAQICTKFQVVSHHEVSKTAFRATIKFPAYTREEIDRYLAEFEGDPEAYVPGGEYLVETIEFDRQKKGLGIFTKDLRDTYRKRMRQFSNKAVTELPLSREPYRSFSEFLQAIYTQRPPLRALSLTNDYDQLLFNLALVSPIPYYDEEPRNIALSFPRVRETESQLKSYEFTVEMDNLGLSRPLFLPSDSEGHKATECRLSPARTLTFELIDGSHRERVGISKYDITVSKSDEVFGAYEFEYRDELVGGRLLHFRGYLFNQTGRLYPRDIQGLLIRVRQVAVGGYDSSLMLYPLAEGPRFSMVSAEIQIIDGFEDALNIDRDSFNALDPHYVRVQAFLHSMLGTIFREIWTREKSLNKARREDRAARVERQFLNAVRKAYGKKVRALEIVELGEVSDGAPVYYDKERAALILNEGHPLVQAAMSRRKFRQLAQQMSVAFELSLQKRSEAEMRRVFYQLLASIFGER